VSARLVHTRQLPPPDPGRWALLHEIPYLPCGLTAWVSYLDRDGWREWNDRAGGSVVWLEHGNDPVLEDDEFAGPPERVTCLMCLAATGGWI
jgi:hypothetical protein